jgi:tripartite-type tricarboxylate transporter receptor subunit TctC
MPHQPWIRLAGSLAGFLAALLVASLSLGSPAWAFPDRPVRIIVPYAPGGGNDTLARVLGQKLSEQWNKPVVVENKTGGNTIIASEYTAHQPADGYLILMVTTVFSVNPSLLQKLPYDTLADFTPIVLAGTTPNVLIARPSLPANSIKELVDYAHANPGKLTYGTPGVGTAPDLAAELLNIDADLKTVKVVYRGTQPQLLALLSGDIDYAFDVVNSLEYVKAGKLKALAVTTAKRLESYPEIPTMGEAGIPGYEAATWYGFVVRSGTPPEIVNQINQAFNNAIRSPDMRARMSALGIGLVGSSAEEFKRYIGAEMDKWGGVIRQAGIKPEAAP